MCFSRMNDEVCDWSVTGKVGSVANTSKICIPTEEYVSVTLLLQFLGQTSSSRSVNSSVEVSLVSTFLPSGTFLDYSLQ